MTTSITDYVAVGRKHPAKAADLWANGETISFSPREQSACVRRLQSFKWDKAAMDMVRSLNPKHGDKFVLDERFIRTLDIDLPEPEDPKDPPVVAMMTGIELAIGAATVMALGIALGILAEGAVDGESEGTTVNVTNNGDGTTTVINK